MRDLRLSSGDLVIGARGFGMVDGTDYLTQRIATALAEPYGDDPYAPQWGSTLYTFLGRPVAITGPDETSALVGSEVSRVLAQLMAAQQAQITYDSLSGARSQYNAADIIASVTSVNAAIDPASADTIQVSITLVTMSQQQLVLTRTLSTASGAA